MKRFGPTLLVVALLMAALPALAVAGQPADPGSQRAQAALRHAQDLLHGVGVRTGRELTPALAQLTRLRGHLDAAGRKQADSLLARPTDTEASPGHPYTVPEATPFCTVHFCIHYVTTTIDAPDQTDANGNGVPDYVEQMASVFENEVFPCENGSAAMGCSFAGTPGLGWPQAPSDGRLGGDSRFDVYIENLYPSGVYGYVSPDPSQSSSTSYHSYLVMDKDFSRYSSTIPGIDEMRVTAAHEYNHVLQFGIDPNEDTWMFESTATFFENEVYPSIDDYLGYMSTWVNSTADPLTDSSGGNGLKEYGSAVWNHFIAGRHGAGTILAAWQAKTQVNGGSFAPASYSTAIAANGGTSFSSEFDDFSAAVAEWDVPGSGFPDTYPDVPASARPNMTVGAAAASITLDHTTFAFRNIAPPASSSSLTLTATLPSGLQGAIALVGRTGSSTTSGTVTRIISRTTSGGTLTATLPNASTFGRITAVFVNADPSQSGWNNTTDDWNFTKDHQTFTGIRVTAGSATVAAPAPPTVTTGGSGSLFSTTATVTGTVDTRTQSTTYKFEYGTSTAYGQEVDGSLSASNSPISVAAPLSGLTAGTTYHYRLVATNAGGTTAGPDATFTTAAAPVAKSTSGSTDASSTSSVASTTPAPTPTTTAGSTTPSDSTASAPAAGPGSTGEPATSSTGAAALHVTLSTAKTRLARLLAKGLVARAGCGQTCALTVRLVIPAKVAKRLHLKATLVTMKIRSTSTRALVLKLSKKERRALAHLRRLQVTLVANARADDGRTAAAKKLVKIAR